MFEKGEKGEKGEKEEKGKNKEKRFKVVKEKKRDKKGKAFQDLIHMSDQLVGRNAPTNCTPASILILINHVLHIRSHQTMST